MKSYIPIKEPKVNRTVEKLQRNCPFKIDSTTQLSITGVVSPRAETYGIICAITAATGAVHTVVIRVTQMYYLAAKALLEFARNTTGLEQAAFPIFH